MGGLGCLYIPYDSMFCTWKGKDETGEIFVFWRNRNYEGELVASGRAGKESVPGNRNRPEAVVLF